MKERSRHNDTTKQPKGYGTRAEGNRNKTSFFLRPLTMVDLLISISSLKENKSYRSDSPAVKFIKISKDVIAPYIAYIFNKCIEEGIFPSSLKVAEVIPIYKSGKRSVSNNYRPISLLSPFSKLFENHIYNQLIKFFNNTKTLHHQQYGFRKNSSTEIAISDIYDKISNAVDQKKICCTVFLDLAKAFNTVDPEILVKKLCNYGVRGLPLKLLESYLKNRYQYTKVNGVSSNISKIDIGVPQGSSLGPLMFLIYINDLPDITNMDVRLFADDACLSLQDDDPKILQDKVNSELIKINQWLMENKLHLNYGKSTYLIFTNRKNKYKFKISINDMVIGQSYSTKYLGVTIDEKLSWKDHIQNLKSKLAKNCYALAKAKNYLDQSTLRSMYYSLIYSHLQYGISSWGCAAKSHLTTVETLQKQALRHICLQPRLTHTHHLFKSQKILKLNDIFKFQICKIIFKTINNMSFKRNPFTNIKNRHKYNTRTAKNHNFAQPQRRTTIGQRSFNYKAPGIWRRIPTKIKSAKLFSTFKTILKDHLLSFY